ncbi:hypothetical protein WISP_54325 [Willisornis vidua]|uniref:Uncharacterized protein n=1 Tax=Willisornis vidua TaxID=1566151 RepID=A0ABQ9DD93_9PASS|nr:hypothetical protein WISP_54325 [Willisornis vidua]
MSWKAAANFSFPGCCPSWGGQAVTLQMAVRLEQRLGPPNAETRRTAMARRKEAAQQEAAAAVSSNEEQEKTVSLLSSTHTLAPAFRQLRMEKCPQNQKRQPVPTQEIKKKTVAVNYFPLLTNGMGS